MTSLSGSRKSNAAAASPRAPIRIRHYGGHGDTGVSQRRAQRFDVDAAMAMQTWFTGLPAVPEALTLASMSGAAARAIRSMIPH